MGKRKKILKSISVIGLAGVASLSGCGGEGEGHAESNHEEHLGTEGEGLLSGMFTGEGEGESATTLTGESGEGEGESGSVSIGEGGEGEGGEGEGEGSSGATDLATNDLAYLTQLSLIEGHLLVGYELYEAGHTEAASTHMKHPEDELYAALIPAFTARGVNGLEDELKQLSTAVENNESVEVANDAYEALTTAIENAKPHINSSAKEQLKLASELLKVAAEEYGIAVVEGKLKNAHEYQDAFGFTRVAQSIVESVEADNDKVELAKENAIMAIDSIMHLWPGLIPPDELTTEAGEIYGAAARVELMSAGL